ncbi:MAG: hypothetical protein J7549_01575 [Variovorax sp.]|nr:hypothetical protein [Variovorax sp.]
MTDPLLPKEEYAALHDEAAHCMTELGALERGCVIGTAAVLAWLATNAESLVSFAGLAWAVPVAIVAYGSLRRWGIHRHLSAVGERLRELEALRDGGERAPRRLALRWVRRARASALAWLVFVGATVVGSALGYVQFRSECPGPLASACSQEDGDDGAEEQEQRLKLGTPAARVDRWARATF